MTIVVVVMLLLMVVGIVATTALGTAVVLLQQLLLLQLRMVYNWRTVVASGGFRQLGTGAAPLGHQRPLLL